MRDETPPTMADADEDTAPEAKEPSGGRLRRWLRGRPGAALAGSLAGALLAGGLVAWQTDSLPLASREEPVCWDALPRDTAAELSGEDFEAHELPLAYSGMQSQRFLGECRIEDRRHLSPVVASVRELASSGLDSREWPAEFLNARMVPLGEGLTGMVSPVRAWVALPKDCQPDGILIRPPKVVSLSRGYAYTDIGSAEENRELLARAVVELANGVLERFDCGDPLPAPGRLEAIPEFEKLPRDELCRAEGMRTPESLRGEGRHGSRLQLVRTGTDGAVRTCELSVHGDVAELRLLTIEEPRLAPLYWHAERFGEGDESYRRDLGVFDAKCQDGDVTFVAQRADDFDPALTRELFTAYVTAEGRRLGCDQPRVAAEE